MAYSRRQTVEEKKNKRKAATLVTLSIVFVVLMFFYGLPLLVKLANVAYDFKKTSQPIEINDTTPPPPPRIDALPVATNKTSLTISGSSEPGATVIIDQNGKTHEAAIDNDGKFSLTIDLSDGENFIKASTKDSAGNESYDTKTYSVTFDNEKPELTITSPQNGSDFYGSSQKKLTIKGTTEEDVKLQINDRLAIVDSSGNFSFPVQLNEGTNSFNIKATDLADNTTEVTIDVNFTP